MKENMEKGKPPWDLERKIQKQYITKAVKIYIFPNPSSIWFKYSCNISELWLLFPLIILRNHPKEFLFFCIKHYKMHSEEVKFI